MQLSLQQVPIAISFQDLHLLDGYLIEFYEALTLRNAIVD